VTGWAEKKALTIGGGFTLDPSVRKLRVGLSWDAGVDVDSSAVTFNSELVPQQCVYFGNLNAADGSISHRYGLKLKFAFFCSTACPPIQNCDTSKRTPIWFMLCSGDNRTGDGAGDDETITVKLSKLPKHVMHVAFLINVFNRPNLGDVRSCTARVYHGSKKEKFRNTTLMELPISTSPQFDSCRGLFVFVLVRNDAWWSVHAVGVPAMCVTADHFGRT
jgi:stress response protein SCP2